MSKIKIMAADVFGVIADIYEKFNEYVGEHCRLTLFGVDYPVTADMLRSVDGPLYREQLIGFVDGLLSEWKTDPGSRPEILLHFAEQIRDFHNEYGDDEKKLNTEDVIGAIIDYLSNEYPW